LKTPTLLLFILAFNCSVFAQSYQFEVILKDKDTLLYKTSTPSDFLTSKSILRKSQHLVNVTIEDFPVSLNYLDSLNKYFAVKAISKWFNLSVVQTNDSMSIDTLKKFPFVESFKFIGKSGFSVTRVSAQTASNEIDYGSASTGINQVQGEHLHDNNYLGEGVTIAVLDAGFSNVNTMDIFDSLYIENRILHQKNFIFPSNDIYELNTHGTQVLSILAGNKEGEYVGSAPKAKYIILITEDAREENLIEEYIWINGAEYADSLGTDIITSSLGYNTFDTPEFDHLQSQLGKSTVMISRGAKKASEKGILVITSAGNEGDSPWEDLLFPADEELVLTIGSVNDQGTYSSFSSSSPSGLGFVKPNVVALGEKISTSSESGIYSKADGTSYSCPLITGLAACLWQALPSKSSAEIKEIIEQSAHQYNAPDNFIGYGIPNFSQTIEHAIIIDQRTSQSTLFPNPALNNQVTLKHLPSLEVLKVELYDNTGHELEQVIYYEIDNTLTLTLLPHLLKGSYFLKFNTTLGIIRKQIIVN